MSTEEKREKMFSMVEDWKASGLTQKAFGLLHGINVATLGYWGAKSKEQGTGSRGFIEMPFGSAVKGEQTEIIKKYDEIDKRLKSGENDLLNVLETFLNDEAYTVKGKTVSTGDFLMYHNKMLDSLDQYKRKYEFAQELYGINFEIVMNADSTVSTLSRVGDSRADSASILYLTFKDRLSIKNGKWITTIPADYKDEYESLLVKYENLRKDNRKVLEQIKKFNNKLDELKLDSLKLYY